MPPQEALLRVIGAAIHAPNAVNRQPWCFVAVRDQSLLDRISRDAKAYMTSVRPLALPEHLYDKLADPDFHVF
jgi:nitroreductase